MSKPPGRAGGVDFLVLAPPVVTPSERPAGAFLLSAALRARGFSAVLLDLSLHFYSGILEGSGEPQAARAADDLRSGRAFTPHLHRSACGALHHALSSARLPAGWRLTLMDLEPPCGQHSPAALEELSRTGRMPFAPLWEGVLDPALDDLRPDRVLVSIAYLSQLTAAVDLCRHLAARGQQVLTGGSLPNSIGETGTGGGLLGGVLPGLTAGDGEELAGAAPGTLLDRLAWPDELLPPGGYMTPGTVVPFTTSRGCWWNRCLFCPDRSREFREVPPDGLEELLSTMPSHGGGRPLVHLLDSAVRPSALERLLPAMERHRAGFYGFARPEGRFADPGFLARCASAGCAMLQLGVESADADLLARMGKGLDPATSSAVLRSAAEAGIRTYAYMLFGLPGEDGASRSLTFEFLERNSQWTDFLNLSVFNLPARCELLERSEEFGMDVLPPAGPDRIRLYRQFTTAGGASRRFGARADIARARASHPGLDAAVVRTPRWFRAAHHAMMRLPGRRSQGV